MPPVEGRKGEAKREGKRRYQLSMEGVKARHGAQDWIVRYRLVHSISSSRECTAEDCPKRPDLKWDILRTGFLEKGGKKRGKKCLVGPGSLGVLQLGRYEQARGVYCAQQRR